jgi:hypothetical protein
MTSKKKEREISVIDNQPTISPPKKIIKSKK